MALIKLYAIDQIALPAQTPLPIRELILSWVFEGVSEGDNKFFLHVWSIYGYFKK